MSDKQVNARFADYVQSIAFNLTLSRSMIEALGLMWHHGALRDMENWKEPKFGNKYISSHTVPIGRALERRGLREWLPYDAKSKGTIWKLTEAGEKVCELLVVAGMLEARSPSRVRRAA